ncbi:MAG: hypothetical protein M3Y84_06360, partial [Acidobacteriota bacterium]|nr:hypothetical protein [Acidobacteriota bacterium]
TAMHVRTGRMVQKVFELLLDHPEGLTIRAILDHIAETDGLSEKSTDSFEEVMRGCVAPIKAGWLLAGRHHLTISDEGKQALTLYRDPAKFIQEAGRRSAKGWLSVHFTKPYYVAGKLKDQWIAEMRAARRIGLSNLVGKTFGKTPPWEQILPLQKPRRVGLEDLEIDGVDSLLTYLESKKLDYNEGGHAVYLPPVSFQATVFGQLAAAYPADAGLKIVKGRGGIYDGGYIHETTKGDSQIHLRLVHNHAHLSLVANLLYSKNVGPRLYDLLELQCGDQLFTAYVIEHVGGAVPSMPVCEAGIQQLRHLETQGLIRVILPEGFNDEEFECPTCCNNALTNQNGEFRYIDFQNFILLKYESYLRSVAVEATEASHFGDTSLLRGGQYLYQSVPGVDLPGKRSIDERVKVLEGLLKSANLSVNDRLVLDVGCNIGMMMAQYLKLGARWCHGWDRGHVTPHTEKLLLALGCTRFSTTGGDITVAQNLEEDLPAFLRPQLNGCVISYLAVRGHLGWLNALARIPWQLLIYEGHEGETQEEFEHDMKQYGALTNFRLGGVTRYVDGDSDERTLALLVRT